MNGRKMIPDVTLYDKTFEVYIPKKRIEATVLDLVDHVAHDLGEAACPIFVGGAQRGFPFHVGLRAALSVQLRIVVCQDGFLPGNLHDGTRPDARG